MNPQEINFKERYQPLSRKVDDYNDVQSALKEAYELTKKVKDEINKEIKKNKNSVKNYNDYNINNFGVDRVDDLNKLYNKFLLEYSELENNIKKSLEDDQKISKEERLQIMFELSDIVNLAENKGISERKNIASTLGDLWKGTNTKDVKEKANDLRDKNIDSYSKEEAIAAMKYLSENYNNYSESKVNVSVLNNNIDSLDDKYEVRDFQDKLSKKIFGEGKEFNDNYILGFSNDKGNYIVDIKEFEKNSKHININNINSRLLANYLLYLNSKDALNATGLNNRFNKNFLEDLSKIWDNDKYSSTAKSLLEEKGILKYVKDAILINKKDTEELSSILDIAKKIETQDNEYFLKHPEQIILLKNGEKVKDILNLLGDTKILGNKKIGLTNINPELRNKSSIFLNKNIELDFDDFGLIDIKIIESNFDKIISKLKKYDGGTQIEIFLMKAAQKGINKEILSKGIEKHKIKINDAFLYIKYYLGEVEGVSKESFDKIKNDTNNFENFDPAKVNDKDSYIITNYILNNIDDDNVVRIFRTLINKDFFGKNAEFFFMGGNLKSSIELVKKNPAYIVYIPEEFKGNKLIINEILLNKEFGFNEKMGIIQEANLTNINSVLMIYNFFTENKKDKNNFIKTFLSFPKIGNTIFNSINKNNGENIYIDTENIKIYEQLKNLLIENKHILNQYYDELLSMKNATIDYQKKSSEYKNKDEFKMKFLNDLSEDYKNSGIPSIISETFKDKEIDESSIQDLYINLLNNKDKLPKDKKIEEIFKEIAKKLKDFKLESAKKLVTSIASGSLEGLSPKLTKIDEKGEKSFDFDTLKNLFSNEIRGKTKIEIEKIKIEFIEKYGKDLNEKTKLEFKEILNNLSAAEQSELIENNTKEYIKYIESGANTGFIEYAKENKIELKDSNNEMINLINNKLDDNSIIKTNEYEYNNKTGSLKIGKENIALTENEQKNIAKNEIARENIVNFYKFFEELNLLSVWKYRNELLTSIGDININQNDGDSIKKEELRKFGNKILTFIKNIENKNNGIDKKEKVDLTSLNSVNQSLRNFSGANSSLSDTKKFNSYGDDMFGNLMRKYGIIGGTYFHINEFRKYI